MNLLKQIISLPGENPKRQITFFISIISILICWPISVAATWKAIAQVDWANQYMRFVMYAVAILLDPAAWTMAGLSITLLAAVVLILAFPEVREKVRHSRGVAVKNGIQALLILLLCTGLIVLNYRLNQTGGQEHISSIVDKAYKPQKLSSTLSETLGAYEKKISALEAEAKAVRANYEKSLREIDAKEKRDRGDQSNYWNGDFKHVLMTSYRESRKAAKEVYEKGIPPIQKRISNLIAEKAKLSSIKENEHSEASKKHNEKLLVALDFTDKAIHFVTLISVFILIACKIIDLDGTKQGAYLLLSIDIKEAFKNREILSDVDVSNSEAKAKLAQHEAVNSGKIQELTLEEQAAWAEREEKKTGSETVEELISAIKSDNKPAITIEKAYDSRKNTINNRIDNVPDNGGYQLDTYDNTPDNESSKNLDNDFDSKNFLSKLWSVASGEKAPDNTPDNEPPNLDNKDSELDNKDNKPDNTPSGLPVGSVVDFEKSKEQAAKAAKLEAEKAKLEAENKALRERKPEVQHPSIDCKVCQGEIKSPGKRQTCHTKALNANFKEGRHTCREINSLIRTNLNRGKRQKASEIISEARGEDFSPEKHSELWKEFEKKEVSV